MNCEIPEKYGGLGLSCLEHCLVLEEIAYGCAGVNTSMAANMLGSMPLLIAGSEEQKAKYLGSIVKTPIYAAYCCSEPDAGSDVAGMSTRRQQARRRLCPQRPEALDHERRRGQLVHGLRHFDKASKHKGIHLLRRRRERARRARRQEGGQDGAGAAPTPATSSSRTARSRRARSSARRAAASRSP